MFIPARTLDGQIQVDELSEDVELSLEVSSSQLMGRGRAVRQILLSAFILFASVAALASTAEFKDCVLSECAAGGDSLQFILRESVNGKTVFAISAGNNSSRQGFNLQTPALEKTNKKPVMPLKIDSIEPRNASSLIATVAIDSESEDAKWISVWLVKSGNRWTLRGEWWVEKFNHKELGEKNETHAFAFNGDGTLTRRASRNNIEGVQTTCPQGCCKIWQSKTLVTEEVEILAWNDSERTLERRSFQRWYISQYGDSLMSIAIKVLGSAEKMTTLYYLNPALQKQTSLELNQKVLVEKVPR
jgi:hypothetical protein